MMMTKPYLQTELGVFIVTVVIRELVVFFLLVDDVRAVLLELLDIEHI